MSAGGFHAKPFGDSTITKLEIFQSYVREWLPVFLSQKYPPRSQVHIYDFFAGPGTDSEGTPGSPLRVIEELRRVQNLDGWQRAEVHAHFFDAGKRQIRQLRARLDNLVPPHSKLVMDVRPLRFAEAFAESRGTLGDPSAAKLLLIDQFGVQNVTENVFGTLVSAPVTDFLFFISSSTLNRFREHPAIKQKIDRPLDTYHVHRAVLSYYRDLLPAGSHYYLGSFSIKKDRNIYGLIFGSGHALGMDKFLNVAWQKDRVSGEANFDIDRNNFDPQQPKFEIADFAPTKLFAFREQLVQRIRAGSVRNEADVIHSCFEFGVLRQHAAVVLGELEAKGVIELSFRSPDIDRLDAPRPIRYIGEPLFW